jgi:hypothetical protein
VAANDIFLKKREREQVFLLLQHFKQTFGLKVSHDKDSIRFEGEKELGILYLRNKTKEIVVSQACTRRIKNCNSFKKLFLKKPCLKKTTKVFLKHSVAFSSFLTLLSQTSPNSPKAIQTSLI